MINDRQRERLLNQFEKHCRLIEQATSIDITETFIAKQQRIKELEKDYICWFEYYFPNYAKVACATFHKEMAQEVINNRVVNLLAEIYRSGGKSVHLNMGIPLYLYLAKKDLRYMLLIGENDLKAIKLLSRLQSALQRNKRIINDYGEKFQQGDWSNGNFATVDGIRFQAIGWGVSPRGAAEDENRPDYISIDDVDSKKHVNNDRIMSDSIDYIMEDVKGCFDDSDNATQRLIFANNNFHKNSITNRLKTLYLQKIKEAKEHHGLTYSQQPYKIITVKAVKDLTTFEPAWKAKTSADYWRKKYNTMPTHSFMREYMHTHIQKGSLFKPEHIQYCKPLRFDKYDSLILYGDLSYKDSGDYKALVLVGKIGRDFHILAAYVRRGSRKMAAEWLYNLYEDKHLERYNVQYYIEGLFAMDDFVNDFDLEGDKRGYHIPVVADKKNKANKYDRIESMLGFFERLNMFFNELLKNSADMVTLVDQLLAFEKGSSANDDAPDALQSAIAKLNAITHVNKFDIRTNHYRSKKKPRF